MRSRLSGTESLTADGLEFCVAEVGPTPPAAGLGCVHNKGGQMQSGSVIHAKSGM